jgi:hypothetical protein
MSTAWKQDCDGRSWVRTDVDGTFIRVSKTSDGDDRPYWVLAWTEATGGHLRIGSVLHPTAERAMAHADNTIVLVEQVKALASP